MAAKKQTFAEYRKAGDEVKEYLIVQEKIASLYEERKENEADRKRQQEQER